MKRTQFVIVGAFALLNFGIASPATTIQFATTLLGATEDPPVPSPGTGSALVTYDDVAHTLAVHVEFADLVGTTTVAHIHAPTAAPLAGNIGVATYPGTFPGFPAGVTSGIYDGSWDLTLTTSYTGGFLALNGGTAAGAEAGLFAAMSEGKSYVNVHTTFRPGGEIRGFLLRVPETGSVGILLGIGCLATLGLARFSRD